MGFGHKQKMSVAHTIKSHTSLKDVAIKLCSAMNADPTQQILLVVAVAKVAGATTLSSSFKKKIHK